jgi:hypothetical protein
MAWNDQNPNGSTSSVKAHSKSLLAFDNVTKAGMMIVHSMPKFPSFENNKINATISSSERVYGQHFFCFSTSENTTQEILQKVTMARLNIYESTFEVNIIRSDSKSFSI